MFNRELAKKLKDDQGRQTKWLADRCGVESNTIALYLAGTRNPSKAVVRLMAMAFEVPEDQLWFEQKQAS